MTVLREAYVVVVPDLDNFDGALRRALRRINVDGDGRRIGATLGTSMSKGFAAKSGTFAKVAATMAARMTLMATAATAAAPAIIQMTSALAPAVGAAGALPAVLGSAAAAIGTLKVATAGVGDAIKAGLTGTSKEAAEALAKLPREAQQFTSTITGMKGQLNGLKATVANRFFGPFNDELGALGTKYLPMAKAGMGEVAGSLGGLGEEFVKAAMKGTLFDGVRATLANTALGLGRARTAVEPLTNALGTMLTATAPLLSEMGASIGSVGVKFGDWLTEISKSGALVEMIRAGLGVFQQLGTIAANVGSILGSVFSAAQSSGGNLLATIGQLTGQLATFLNSAEGQSALTAVFTALASVGSTLGSTLGVVLPMIGQALQAIAPVVPPLIAVIGTFVQSLAPILPIVGQLAALVGGILVTALGTILPVLGPLITMIVTFAGQLLTGLMPVIAPIVQVIAMMAAVLGQVLMDALTALMPGLMGIINAVVSLLPVLMPLIMAVVQLSTAFLPLLPAIAELASTIIGVLLPVLVPVISFIAKLATTILGYLIPPIQLLVQVIASSLGPIFLWLWKNVVTPVWDGIKGAIMAVVGWFTGTAWPAIKAAYTALADGFTWLKDGVLGAWAYIKDGIYAAWVWVRVNAFDPLRILIFKTIPDAFDHGIGLIGQAWDKLKELARKPVAFVVNSVINPLIGGYNKVAGVFGLGKLNEITGFAAGGQIPGVPSVRDNRLAAGPNGLLKVASGEFITNTRSTMANLPLLRAINAKRGPVSSTDIDPYLDGFARGGLPYGAGDGIGDFFGNVFNGIKGASEFVTNPKAALTKLANGALALMPGADTTFGKVLGAMARKVLGGIAGWLDNNAGGGAIGGGGVAGGYRGMQALISRVFPQLHMISAFRPGARTLTGHQSYHAVGRAVDYPANRALAAWIRATYGANTLELITPWPELNLWHGRPHTYTGAVWNQHNFAGGNAHVHWAAALGGLIGAGTGLPFGSYDAGGYLPPGLSVAHNGTGRPEPVGYQPAGNTYNLSVNVPVGAHPAEVGRQIIEHIKAFEAGSGARWRTA